MLQVTKLSSIAVIRSGYSFRGPVAHKDKGIYGVIQAKDIKGLYIDERKLIRSNQYFSEERLQKTGDILLSSRGSFRATVYGLNRPTVAASSVFVLRLTSNKFTPEFIAAYLDSAAAQNYFFQNAHGATIQSLNLDSLNNLKVPVIPVEQQHLIVGLQQNVERQKHVLQNKLLVVSKIYESAINISLEGVK